MLKKADKIELTKSLISNLDQAEGFVVCCFRGLTVLAMNSLRKQMFAVNAKVQVVKNRLLLRALGENSGISNKPSLNVSSMVILSKGDCLEALRILGSFVKEYPELELNAGVLSKVEYAPDQIIEMSKLPGKIEVISLLAGSMVSVLSIFNSTLEALVNKKESNS